MNDPCVAPAQSEQQRNQKILVKQVKDSEDVDTSDQRSKVFIVTENDKKTKAEQGQKQNNDKQKDDDLQMFCKMPSYFLQVFQDSLVIQEQQEQTVSVVATESFMKKQSVSVKMQDKFKNVEQARKIKDQLTHSGIVFNCDECKWRQTNAFIWDQYICLEQQKIPIAEVTKVKCLLQTAGEQMRKIKICYKNKCFHLAASCCDNQFSEHYLWFSKIISNRLYMMKREFKHSKQPPIPILSQQKVQGTLCSGTMYKKSQYLLNWDIRYIIITRKQLISFKQKTTDPTFVINSQNIKYIWTRFDLFNQHLIVKVKHGVMKTQFAIPLLNYSSKVQNNWLYAFYCLMMG